MIGETMYINILENGLDSKVKVEILSENDILFNFADDKKIIFTSDDLITITSNLRNNNHSLVKLLVKSINSKKFGDIFVQSFSKNNKKIILTEEDRKPKSTSDGLNSYKPGDWHVSYIKENYTLTLAQDFPNNIIYFQLFFDGKLSRGKAKSCFLSYLKKEYNINNIKYCDIRIRRTT